MSDPYSIKRSNPKRGTLRRQVASSLLSNLASGSSSVGSAALSAVSSVLPSLSLEPNLRPVGLYNNKREAKKRESRKKAYNKTASNERNESRRKHEEKIEATFKSMAQKLMNKKKQEKSKVKLSPIKQSASRLRKNIGPLNENNHVNENKHEHVVNSLSELYFNPTNELPIITGNVTGMFSPAPQPKYPRGRISNPMKNHMVQYPTTPDLENNYVPQTGSKISKKHGSLLNAKIKNRIYRLEE